MTVALRLGTRLPLVLGFDAAFQIHRPLHRVIVPVVLLDHRHARPHHPGEHVDWHPLHRMPRPEPVPEAVRHDGSGLNQR